MHVIIISISLIVIAIAFASSSVSYFTSSKSKTVLLVSIVLSLLAAALILGMLFTVESSEMQFILTISALLVCLSTGIANLVAIVNMQDVSHTAYYSVLTSLVASFGALAGIGSLFLLKEDTGVLQDVKQGANLKAPYTNIVEGSKQLSFLNKGG